MKHNKPHSIVGLIKGLDPERLSEVQTELGTLSKLKLIRVMQLRIGPETPNACVIARALVRTAFQVSYTKARRKAQSDAFELMVELLDGAV